MLLANLPFFMKPFENNEARNWGIGAVLIGFLLVLGLSKIPIKFRRPITVFFTFIAGGFYVLKWLWPKAPGLDSSMQPLNSTEAFSFVLTDGTTVMGKILQVLQGILLFLGVYSVLRIHSKRFIQQQKDWVFSLVLLVSMLLMMVVGYGEYLDIIKNPAHGEVTNWTFWQVGKDFLFDGMLQNMDAAMFSIIAFFIISAAYRAFRIRSLEATILLGTAMIVMLSLMGAVEYASGQAVNSVTGGDPGHFFNNFSLASIRQWIQATIQGPAIRALEWGIFIGSLTMGLRLWLSLEKSGGQ